MNDNAIQFHRLVKYYEGRRVLNEIDLSIPKGCIYGLLGRNGSGKTTMIRILMGLEHPTRGQTQILGTDSSLISASLRGQIGYVAEGHHLIQSYKVGYLVEITKNLARQWDNTFFQHLITKFRLPLDRKIRQLSMGMRAQLNLALAMAVQPQVLILDDPTLGLDTVARREFLELAIDVIQQQGRTILFSSHILSDVERIADRVGILTGGKIVADCELEELKRRVKKLRVIFRNNAPDSLPITEIIRMERFAREMVLVVVNWNPTKQAMLETFGLECCDEISMNLEDLFIECTKPQSSSPYSPSLQESEVSPC